MKTRWLEEHSTPKGVAVHTFAVRPQTQAWVFVMVGLLLPRVALAQAEPPQAEPPSESIATFPEQSNSVDAPVVAQPAPVTPAPPAAPVASAVPAAPVVASVASAPVAPVPVVADQPSRDGFYLRFGSGSSLLRLSGTGPDGKARVMGLGSSVTLAIGGAIARGLVLSGAMHANTATGDFKGGPFRNSKVTTGGKSVDASARATASLAEIVGILEYYPSVTRGWHVGVGVGLATSSIINSADDSTSYATGLGALVQGGYEWHLGKDWCLGLNLVASGATKGDFKEAEDQKSTDYSLGALAIGVQSALVYF